MGLTFSDHLQTGSKVPRPIVASPRAMTSTCPLPWNGRVSSGEPKLFFVSISSSCGPTAEPNFVVHSPSDCPRGNPCSLGRAILPERVNDGSCGHHHYFA